MMPTENQTLKLILSYEILSVIELSFWKLLRLHYWNSKNEFQNLLSKFQTTLQPFRRTNITAALLLQ